MKKLQFSDLKKRKKETKRKIIIKAALELYYQNSFSDVRIIDIAKAIGTVPATLYKYFPNQNTLFIEALIEDIIFISKEYRKNVIIKKPLSVEEFALGYVRHCLKYKLSLLMLFEAMLNEQLNVHFSRKLVVETNIFFDICEEIIRKNGYTENSRIHCHAIIGALNGLILTFRNHCSKDQKNIDKHMLCAIKAIAYHYR